MLKDILEKFKEQDDIVEEDYIELDIPAEETRPTGKVLIKVDKLEDYADSDRIQKKVREGSILLVEIKALKEKDIGELKRAISRIRKTCIAINGDIAGVSDEWIVVTPSFAKVHRQEREEKKEEKDTEKE